MKRIFATGWLLIGLSVFVAGCQSNESKNDGEQKNVVHQPEKSTYVFPLTGKKTSDQEAVEQRPVAVMVNNDPRARPQSGLHQADLVYEVLAEGAVTRFEAIFQSERPDRIGPVRSARDYYIELASGYDALYVAHGWSPEAKDMLQSGTIDHINGMAYDGTLFERVSFRKSPHNSYITFDHILEGAELNGYDMTAKTESLPFLNESDITAMTGTEADTVTIRYLDRYNVTYQYDPATETYSRFNGDDQTIDYETGTEIALDNVFIVEAMHRVIDSAGRREIDLTTGGDALLLQKGIVQWVQWKNDDGRIVPSSGEGTTGFVPGQTWINIIPNDPGIEEDVVYETNSN